MNELILQKAAIIERCLKRIDEEFAADPTLRNYTHQDALILNLERACQACIDIAMHICAKKHLGIPQNSADAFIKLLESQTIDESIANSMVRMTGFRNRAIHLYQTLDLDILKSIVLENLIDFPTFLQSLGYKIHHNIDTKE